MQELLDECNCALMLCSSAYIDAALRNRNMLIIKGIENEDKYELRNEIEYKNIYRLREESGCVVDYQNVCDYLPEGIACREEHLNKVVTYREDASVHIVDVMEYIYQKFLSRGLFPAILQYNYETYQSEMDADIALTWNQIKSKRIKNMGNNALNALNRVIASINFKPLFEMIDTQYDRYETTVDGARQFLSDCQNLRREILIANREKLMRDPLDQAELLRALYDSGKYDEILEIPCEEILCIGAWNYYTGMLLYNRGNYPASMKHFQDFLKEANTRNFAKYDCEWTGLKTVYCRVARICHEVTLTPEDFAELYEEMFVKKIEGSVPYEERKCLYQYACSMAPVLHKRAQYEMAAKCMYRCMREGEFFRDDKKRADSLQLELNHVYRSLAWRIGCKILSVPQKISWWIHFMRDNGCVCTWKQMIKYIHGKLKATHVYRIKETFQKNILPGYEVYSRMLEKFGDDSWLEVGALGTGNIYICGLYYNTYIKQKEREHTAVYLLPEKNCYEVACLFPVDSGRMSEINGMEYLNLITLQRFAGDKKIRMDYLYYHNLSAQYTGYLTWLEGLHGWNMRNIYDAVFFGGQGYARLISPCFLTYSQEVDELFERTGMREGRTVVLSPFAGTMRTLPVWFWKKLVTMFKKKGFDVCTNCAGRGEVPVEGSESVYVSYMSLRLFVERAGYIIGLRSGLLDIIESAQCKKVALYTYGPQKRGIDGISGLGSFSLNAMFGRNDFLELEATLTNLDEIMDRILQYFEEPACCIANG